MPKRLRAFTLIELLVVIAIIAVLAGILLAVMGKVREQARRIVCGANLRSIGQGLYAYAGSFDGMLPPQYGGLTYETYDTSADSIQPWIAYIAGTSLYRDPQGRLIPLQLGKLFSLAMVDDPRTFYCPSGERRPFNGMGEFSYRHYRDPNGPRLPGNALWSAPSGRPDEKVRTGYMYWIHGRKRLDDLGRQTLVTDRIHTWDTISHTAGNGRPEGLQGLFGDGHVRFCTSERLFDPVLWGLEGPPAAPPGASKAQFERVLWRMSD